MKLIQKIKVTTGIYWIEIPEAGLYVLCGCPEDSVKHLIKMGLIKTIEQDGVSFETGPNAVLLSDVLVQNGHFANLSEFIALQMLYRQGMILPNHPNNTGAKPILIGTEDQVNAQMQYIYRGNYGLISEEEIVNGGTDEETAREMMRMKLKFAFGKIRKTEELLDSIVVDNGSVEIKNGVTIRRTGCNQFEFQYQGESAEVDLRLAEDEEYKPPYKLGFHHIKREYFAVVHSGEGDGWDINNPCMSSILTFQGKIYLIDAGPNIMSTLIALGISVNEIEGIFHSHAHDDHFAGLTTLIHSDHRIKYYATSLVRTSVTKKLAALLSWDSDYLERYFDIHDLEFGTWNNIDGLEVKPVFSPHPIETSIFTFRTQWEDGYRTYAHLADLASLDLLENMITEDSSQPGISRELFNQIRADYLVPVNLKKIDAGGGMIHGMAKDFLKDTSEKIIITHKSGGKLSIEERKISSNAPFGMVDVLIPACQDYSMRNAARLLRDYFPNAPAWDLQMLLNFNVLSYNTGSILLKEGEVADHIYLVLAGIVELIHSESGRESMASMGSLLGELSGLLQFPSMETIRAASNIQALKIPCSLYYKFVKRNKLYNKIERIAENRDFLQSTWLFGEMLSYPVINNIAREMNLRSYSKGEKFQTGNKAELYLLKEGKADISYNCKIMNILQPGDFFCECNFLNGAPKSCEVHVTEDSEVYEIPGDILLGIPVVLWKLLEASEKRKKV